ncbi:MAG TPA: type IV secretory system conjugative DNA transfer family protein [Solirubrobacteraceae bacterium]|nr:type IV secretory system conjugative DNA transfer family protein [Solirubrobacteraceae bacterium]
MGRRPALRLFICTAGVAVLAGMLSGAPEWCWTQTARVLELHGPMRLPAGDAARALWHLLLRGGWVHPAGAFPKRSERASAPGAWAYALSATALVGLVARGGLSGYRRVRSWRGGSPLGKRQRTLARRAVERGWVRPRTWALPADMRRLWVGDPASGRPYLGVIGRMPPRTLAAEPEVQPMVVSPPRVGKSSGYVIPWLLDHDGPALALSTKLDTYNATAPYRRSLGRVWVYDPFGDAPSAGFSPLVPARTWSGALRAGEALASAAHPDQANAANEFWDKEAASMLAPLLHAAALADVGMGEVVRWLDSRDLKHAVSVLKRAGASAAADQLEGVGRRDERNRETTVMSALNLLRAYRYPQVAACARDDLTPERFLDGKANTIYVVAAEHDQEVLRPVILALISAIYQAAIVKARKYGQLDPRLFILCDEIANIAPLRHLPSWLSQCGDHGIVIATLWQSIAQIDHRYGRPARDAICAASTAQVFLPPLADPTTVGYLTEMLGEEPVANASSSSGLSRQSLSIAHQKAGPPPWLRQIERGQAFLLYRDLPPAIVSSPRWFEDPRFERYARVLKAHATRRARVAAGA